MYKNVFAILSAEKAIAFGVVIDVPVSMISAEKSRCWSEGVTLVGGTDFQLLVNKT
jgi:hypothetical protein